MILLLTASMAEQLRALLVCEKSRVRFPKAGQILHSFANGSIPLQHLRK